MCSAVLMLLLIDDAPTPGDTVLAPISDWMLPYKYVIRPAITEHSEILLANTEDDDAIYAVSLIDDINYESMCRLHEVFIKYEITPRTVYWIRYTFQTENFIQDISSGESDYLYLHNITSAFIEEYGDYFTAPPENYKLYKIDASDDEFTLIPVN